VSASSLDAGVPHSTHALGGGRPEAAFRPSRGPQSHDARDRISVLLVEDSPVLAERLREMLDAMPEVGRVCTVDRETAAVDALGPWDVLILDLHLKQGRGFGVLRALRGRPEMQPLVVVFTNHDVPGYRRRAAAFGVEHFLDKARDFERLGELLRALHGARGAALPNN
jgi:DNA-binding NarL/FixJ family response regulator